ncbi:hypothetical protein NG798_20925 [Ancylothrix sp. C2]|uniref:SPOR domain-containing protein n=1 Tax=Ancylothrix sp. D3o TaxID=2953691 RepID=UPI0021BA7C58|nr:hypothetical protein [Ancylothrix sp. D3o]MCT7952263.1 hypothetical protein [Ancylothrix sp. D3o]
MSSTSDKSTSPQQSFLSAQTLVIAGLVWAVLALLFFLLFSVPDASGEKPLWYVIGTYIFECGALLAAGLLCLRNWRSPQIVSGRNVWLGIGLGVLSYFVGNLLFGCWELVWGLDPDVSLGDVFYIISYLLLAWGMILAVISRRLNLELWQWAVLVGIAAGGIALAVWVATPAQEPAAKPATAVVSTLQDKAKPAQQAKTPAKAPTVKPATTKQPTTAKAAQNAQPAAEEEITAPGWVLGIDKFLEPYAYPVNLFYIVGDVFLLIIATALLLAFWGGRFSNSWRMIAAAAFSLYIADMWFKYAETRFQGDYQSGSLLEVFFVFMGVLFGIGAVLEYDISTRSRQTRRKRG